MNDLDNKVEEARTGQLPFESWEKLEEETSAAFSAFCVYRDIGTDRNIRKAIESIEKDKKACDKRYRVWRNYSSQFRWNKRVEDYDRYIQQLKQTEVRKTIEAQGEMHRTVTGKMLEVVKQKLDIINPSDLTHGTITEWVETAIKKDREGAEFMQALTMTPNSSTVNKQSEFSFVTDFQGL